MNSFLQEIDHLLSCREQGSIELSLEPALADRQERLPGWRRENLRWPTYTMPSVVETGIWKNSVK